jgi:hypothetical protein
MRTSKTLVATITAAILSSPSSADNHAKTGLSIQHTSTSSLGRLHQPSRTNNIINFLKKDPARCIATVVREGGGGQPGAMSTSKRNGDIEGVSGFRLDDIKTSAATTTNSDAAASIFIRGGAVNRSTTHTTSSGSDGSISILGLSITSRALATLSMATCMSLHYLAYSLARPATMTLFTSSRLGFGNNVSAYPFAMTFISPVSFILLLFYGTLLDQLGPLLALKHTTLGCASVLGLSSLLISKLDKQIIDNGGGPDNTSTTASSLISITTRYIVGALFVFRESYVQLITSQHWSFISSVLTPDQSSTWFAPISGLTSLTSALAAMGVGKLSGMFGLPGVLSVAALVLGGSVVFGEAAYNIADKVSTFC